MSKPKFLIVTGASKGIGKASAERFIGAGYQVINLSRSPCNVSGVTNIEWDLSSALGRPRTQPIRKITYQSGVGVIAQCGAHDQRNSQRHQ